jgi:antitoxin component HigA of HigAB toxin-antitoxin module
MELRPIKTKREYQAALKEAERLWDAPAGREK